MDLRNAHAKNDAFDQKVYFVRICTEMCFVFCFSLLNIIRHIVSSPEYELVQNIFYLQSIHMIHLSNKTFTRDTKKLFLQE